MEGNWSFSIKQRSETSGFTEVFLCAATPYLLDAIFSVYFSQEAHLESDLLIIFDLVRC